MVRNRYILLFAAYLILLPRLCEASSRDRIAVLDFTCRADLQQQEVDYLSRIIRGEAREALPASQFILMTRENILELLPQGQQLANCLGECAIETGRNIGADYVVTGEVVMYGGELRVTLTLHETENGNLLKSVTSGAKDLHSLEASVLDRTIELFRPIRRTISQMEGGVESQIGGDQTEWAPTESVEVIVSFDSTPQGALVDIDDQVIGETPCSRPLFPGNYDLALKKPRYVTQRKILEVTPEGENKIDIVLIPDFGWLTVTSTPSGLPVSIDDDLLSITPLGKTEIDCGPHEVVIDSEQYYREGKRIFIERGEHEEIDITPTPINGGLKVLAVDGEGNAIEGDVLIDGERIGGTYTSIPLIVGQHELEVHSPGNIWRGEVMILEGQLTEVACELSSSAESGMVLIPHGSFIMGQHSMLPFEKPRHYVKLTHNFLLGIHEVTNAEYRNVLQWAFNRGLATVANEKVYAQGHVLLDLSSENREISFDNRIFGLRQARSKKARDAYPYGYDPTDHPVMEVSWMGAAMYCDWLSIMDGIAPFYNGDPNQTKQHNPYEAIGYRLPTEAEWEYAAQYNNERTYPWGEARPDCEHANWSPTGGANGSCVGWTTPVGSYPLGRSKLGLMDMAGNVCEWVGDWAGNYSSDQVYASDPLGLQDLQEEPSKIHRGGYWGSTSHGGKIDLRCSYRGKSVNGAPINSCGFRICRTATIDDVSSDSILDPQAHHVVKRTNGSNAHRSKSVASFFGQSISAFEGFYLIAGCNISSFLPDSAAEEYYASDGYLIDYSFGFETSFNLLPKEELGSFELRLGMGYDRYGGKYTLNNSESGYQAIDYITIWALGQVTLNRRVSWGMHLGWSLGIAVNDDGRLEDDPYMLINNVPNTDNGLLIGLSTSLSNRMSVRASYYLGIADMPMFLGDNYVGDDYYCTNASLKVALLYKLF